EASRDPWAAPDDGVRHITTGTARQRQHAKASARLMAKIRQDVSQKDFAVPQGPGDQLAMTEPVPELSDAARPRPAGIEPVDKAMVSRVTKRLGPAMSVDDSLVQLLGTGLEAEAHQAAAMIGTRERHRVDLAEQVMEFRIEDVWIFPRQMRQVGGKVT